MGQFCLNNTHLSQILLTVVIQECSGQKLLVHWEITSIPVPRPSLDWSKTELIQRMCLFNKYPGVCVCGCLCMLAARSQQQANDIYESGIKYLRAHKTSARIAHRHDFLKLCSIPAALVSIECARVRGMDFFFGIAFRRCTTLCCKKWCAYTPNTQQFPSSTLRLSTTNWRTAFATVPRLIFKAVAQPLQYLKQFQKNDMCAWEFRP